MSCADGSTTLAPKNVWTKKDTANWLAHAFTEVESAADIGKVRGSLEVRSSTGAIKTRIAYRTTNNGSTFDAWTPLYASGTNEQLNDGTMFGPSFVDLSNVVAGKQGIQWGVEAINASGVATEICAATIKLDKKA